MNRLRFAALTVMLGILMFFSLTVTSYIFAEQGEIEKVSFRWAFVALKKGDGGEKLAPVTRDMTLKRGDQLKMYLELEKKCFVYVFYHGSQGELQLLFPYDMPMFTTDHGISKKYYIPQGNFWIELDENTGLEKFYLLGSAQRLNELERLYGEYTAAVGSAKKQKLAKQVLDEIKNIKRKHLRLATTPERPVQIAGSIRGIDKDKERMQSDLSNMAVEVSATDFYSRTFTIDHQ
jgi:hypothetical protein